MNFVKRLTTWLIISAILISLTGCNENDTSWIAEVNEKKIPVGIYIKYMMDAFKKIKIDEMIGQLSNTKEESEKKAKEELEEDKKRKNESQKEEDANKEEKNIHIFEKYKEGKLVTEWIMDEAKQKVLEYIVINDQFQKLNLNILKSNLDNLEYNLSNQWENINKQQGYEKRGVSLKSILLLSENLLKREKIFEAYYEEGGIEAVSQEELKEYLNNNYNKVKYYAFEKQGLEDKEKENKKKLYSELLNRAKEGEKFDDLIKEFHEKEYPTIEKNTDKVEENTEKMEPDTKHHEEYDVEKQNVEIYKKEYGGKFSKEVKEEIENAEIGVVNGFEGEDQLIVFVKQDPSDSKDYMEENRDQLLSEMKNEELNEKISKWSKDYKIKYNQEAIDKYTPPKLHLDELAF